VLCVPTTKLAKDTRAFEKNIYQVTDPFNGTVYLGISSGYLIGALNLTGDANVAGLINKIISAAE